ncbi:MAG TPA: cysteine--tRNA ligase [Verrucomicrobiota bacterium]|nr:cysteine--tRNA ligase [Verrucomicrobiota bacterium]HNT15641.1 cysteine--tRNA ligase [Verrucomicrobiota bacterium]
MGLRFFNTLSRSVQAFVPLDASSKTVGMYCCGPTVYDFAHIGNWRTFVFADLVRRHLTFHGYAVKHVMNITDVEDKIIRRVRETRSSLREFTAQYEAAFFKDLRTLGCLEPHAKPRATEHIADIIALIEQLVARGIAYQAGDGSVYFSIEKYQGCGHHYGRLQKLDFAAMRTTERVATDEYDKEAVADFALWKAYVPDDGTVAWDSPWGKGRPGWHIECSAMSMKILGASFDLHLGGEDLKFPHHEDEIAQSEGATGRPFAKYWLHGAHLLVEGRKMSKSLGNFFTLPDLLARGFTGRDVRFLLLSAHYRETFNFTLEGLAGARTSLARIDECVGKLRDLADGAPGCAAPDVTGSDAWLDAFTGALDNDFNVAAAWGEIFKWITVTNKAIAERALSASQAATQLAAWKRANSVLGIGTAITTVAPAEIQALLAARQAARAARDFKRSDAIRDELKTRGWMIEDSPKGAKLKKIP